MRPNDDRRVYAIFGSDPELIAYAMAKYSRSSLAMRESLAELNQQKAEKFLNTFYFQYGHRSIADLAHVCLAVENISMLAAMEIVDEPKWDGQERSTRYQDFRETGYYVPNPLRSTPLEKIYRQLIEHLFTEYYEFVGLLENFLRVQIAKPPEMQEATYARTLKARAFDSARYLLPLATVTSVGQILSARVLEEQITRLKSNPVDEIRDLGDALKRAASEPAFDLTKTNAEKVLDSLNGKVPEQLKKELAELACREVRVAPTLIKYSDASEYLIETYRELGVFSKKLIADSEVQPTKQTVVLLPQEELMTETVNTLFYKGSNAPYAQIARATRKMTPAKKCEIIGMAFDHRKKHDEVIREMRSGYALKFDILMDIGSFRDLQRHRRCVKVTQNITPLHGFEIPVEIKAARLAKRYQAAMKKVLRVHREVATDAPECANYVLPMAFRRRALFKMDLAEAQYICELRTAPQGHFSYQAVAYNMFLEIQREWPEAAKHIRVHESWFEQDRLRR
jgi:thymidylate synthase ThyX